jgi:tetratricopeptide (TPR) repeat protein
MSPVGLFSLFSPIDLGVFLGLLAALGVLVVLLPPQWRDQRFGPWLTGTINPFRLPRMGLRVRTAMVLIAILAIYMGWEIVTWRNWRLSDRYRRIAESYASHEANCRASLKSVERALAGFDSIHWSWPKERMTPAAEAAVINYNRDSYRRGYAHLSELSVAFRELEQKYEHLAANPSRPLTPDRPLPEGHRLENVEWSSWGHYISSHADYEELIRIYPDLYWAYERRAWVLATSPEDRYRNGPVAVAAATRAAELTNWNDGDVLSTLAAAYAEIGNFESAVRWQERALERIATEGRDVKRNQERLALYKSGKPFRMRP